MPWDVDLLKNFEVFVIDDEPDVRELLAEFFRSRGLTVATANDGRTGVAAIERDPGRYGLILTDLQLPGSDGLAILRAAKRVNTSAYVVIVTGYASLDSAIEAVRLGAYDYLTKPFSLGQLDVILERICDRLALEAENRRLFRQLGQRLTSDANAAVIARLDAIDERLSRIESSLRRVGTLV